MATKKNNQLPDKKQAGPVTRYGNGYRSVSYIQPGIEN